MQKTIAMAVGCLLAALYAMAVGCLLALFAQCAHADSWTGTDKVNHAAVSASIAKLTRETHGGAVGVMIALIPGAIKEASDLSGSGTPSAKDMAANVCGAIAGYFLPRQLMAAPISQNGVIDGVFIAYTGDF